MGFPKEMDITIPENLLHSKAIIPVELEITGEDSRPGTYYYPVIPTRPDISGAKITVGNKAKVKINPALVSNTVNMATIVVPDKYAGIR